MVKDSWRQLHWSHVPVNWWDDTSSENRKAEYAVRASMGKGEEAMNLRYEETEAQAQGAGCGTIVLASQCAIEGGARLAA